MKRKICIAMMLVVLIGASMAFIPASAQTEQEITVTDARGEIISFEAPPERIVSFMASNTEILFYLGLGDRVVAVDDFSDYPAEVQQLPKVGNAFGVNYELIVNMSADVVVTASYNEDMIERLEDLGQTVIATRSTTIDDIYSDMEMLGRMCGIEEEAKGMADSIRDEMDDLKVDLPEDDRPKVLYVIDTFGGVWTTGGETFQNTLITNAGGHNIAADKTGWISLSDEEIISADPEVIIATESVRSGLEEILEKDSWSEISAVKNENIFYVDDNIMSRPGPRVVDAQGALVDIIAEVLPEEEEEQTPGLSTAAILATVATAAIFVDRRRR